MRQSLKIAISLLVSLILCGAFAVFSFTGLFEILETAFFQPRITAERERQLTEITEKIVRYHRDNFERFQPALEQQFVQTAYAKDESRENIFNRTVYFATLLDEYQNLQLVRLIGPNGRAIFFSSSEADVKERLQTKITYHYLDAVDNTIAPELLIAQKGSAGHLVIDGSGQRFVYALPVSEAGDLYRGTALFYVSKRDLSEYLFRFPTLDFRELFLVDRLGLAVNFPESGRKLISETLAEVWRAQPYLAAEGRLQSETVILETEEGAADRYSLLSIPTGGYGVVGLLVPFSVFQLQPYMKAVLIAAFSLTVFLIVFLVFNLRQDPLLVLSQRIKRLQLTVLQEFIEGKERVDWQRWRSELVGNKDELKSRIKRGVGRIPGEKEAELDGMIDKSWNEIISIIEARIGEPRKGAVDIAQVEQLIQRALDRGQFTLQAQTPVAEKPRPRRAEIVVEEIGIDEVVEPGEDMSPASAEAIEEVEELEEAEAVEEVEELEEAEAVEEVEELEEAEAVEEVEELEEAEAVEEVEELEEADELGEDATLGEDGMLRKRAEEADEDVTLREEAIAEPEAAEAPGELFVEEEAELEVLEAVKEIVPLPPLPQEQLEELPVADEALQPAVAPVSAAAKEKESAQVKEGAVEALVEELEVAEEETTPIDSILGTGEELEMEAIPGKASSTALSSEEIDRIQKRDEEKQLNDYLKSGTIVAYDLKEIEAIIMEQRTSVVMENGVYRVKEEVISAARKGKEGRRRRGLKALAEATLGPGEEEVEGLASGIGVILGEDTILDLETEIGKIREPSGELAYRSPGVVNKIQFFGDGLDYDGYLKAFRRGKTETDRLRSLVELSGKLKAVNAAVFSKQDDSYSMQFKVGLVEPGVEVLFKIEEPFSEKFLSPRKTVIVRESIEKVTALAKKFHPDDLKYMQGAILVPVVYHGSDSFLFLGLPVRREWDIREIINRLDIY